MSQLGRKRWGFGLLILLILFLVNTCNIDWQAISCDNCFEIKPTEGLLTIRISHDLLNPSVPIEVSIKKGNEYQYFFSDTVQSADTSFWLPVDFRYSVTAIYRTETKHVQVVDGDRLGLVYDDSNCQAPCWRPDDGKVDCRLQFN